ncbi:MAG: BON domain-containing protein [Burkholderiaceae bacterium]|jgi:osmotically-inducible protein OsmY|nr:BON domain-containing protein [Burkholderiaceae bacterium]
MTNRISAAGLGRVLLACLAVSGVLSGCVALAGGAVVGGTLLAVDRRTTGTQIDDQTIELRAASAVTAAVGDRAHVNATSYNRVVLLTGEVPTDADRAKVEAAVARVDNVRAVVNELAVMPNSSFGQQSNDALITGKVKAAFIDTKDLQVGSMKVVTERGVVFLMGRVTEAEASSAASAARSVGGVQKVVKVFEIITPAELAALPLPPSTAPAAAPGK